MGKLMYPNERRALAAGILSRIQRPAFGSFDRINRLRVQHGSQPLTPEQYEAARTRYYARFPTAQRSIR